MEKEIKKISIWTWLSAIFFCLVIPTIILNTRLFILTNEYRSFVFFIAFSLIFSVIGFLLSPVALIWCIYLGFREVIFGFSEDHSYFLCCLTKDRFEDFLFSLIPVIIFPSSMAGSLLFAKRLLKISLSAKQLIVIVSISTAVAHGLLLYHEYLERTVDCSIVRCKSL